MLLLSVLENFYLKYFIVDDKTIFKSHSFSNSIVGINSLIDKLNNISTKDILIGLESTGHYWFSVEIRKRKTDAIDSLLIADFIRYSNYESTSLSNENYLNLRNMTRFRHYLIEKSSSLKRKIISNLDQVFPEYSSCFNDIFGQTSKEILLNFNTAEDFKNLKTSDIKTITLKKSTELKLKDLKEISKDSFGINFALDSYSIQIKCLIEQIKVIDKQIKLLESKIENIV